MVTDATEPLLRRDARARRLRLRVDPVTGQAVVTVPPRTTKAEALRFFAQHQDWLTARQMRLGDARPFVPGAVFDLFGTPTTLHHDVAHRGRPRWAEGRLIVGGQRTFFRRRVLDFIRDESARRFREDALVYAEKLGVRVASLAVRDTVSRWGSCTASGRISLSWRLAFAPPAVARYVIAHEVAHLREMNHSRAFWRLLGELVGDPRAEKRWLAHDGPGLMRFGVAEV